MQENARQGYFNGSKPPFGYKTAEVDVPAAKGKKKRLVIDEAEAPTVKRIFDLYDRGLNGAEMGPLQIACHLDERGVKRRGAKWRRNTVQHLLSDTAYMRDYLEARRPHWGARHYKDHEALSKAGGEISERGTRGRGVTIAGPLYPLLALPLRDLDAPTIEAWAACEAKTRPTSARLAWRCLKAFLGWCAEQSEYAPVLASVNAAKTKKTREALGTQWEKIMASMKQKGLGDSQIADAKKFITANDIYGVSMMERAKIFNEAQGSFRESGMGGSTALEAAKTMTPVLAAYKLAMSTLGGKGHDAAEGSFVQLNKIVELMGGLGDTKRASEIVGGVFKAVQGSGKMISERDIRQFITMGGSAVSMLPARMIFGALEPQMGEFGGSAMGTGFNTAYRLLTGTQSKPSKLFVREALNMGLWDSSKLVFNSQGGVKQYKGQANITNGSQQVNNAISHDASTGQKPAPVLVRTVIEGINQLDSVPVNTERLEPPRMEKQRTCNTNYLAGLL